MVVFTAGPEVNKLDVEALQIHQNVLVLDVPVENPGVSALDHGLNNLTEHSLGKVLWQRPFIGYKIEQVLAINFLHHNVIAFCIVDIIQDFYDTFNIFNLLH